MGDPCDTKAMAFVSGILWKRKAAPPAGRSLQVLYHGSFRRATPFFGPETCHFPVKSNRERAAFSRVLRLMFAVSGYSR